LRNSELAIAGIVAVLIGVVAIQAFAVAQYVGWAGGTMMGNGYGQMNGLMANGCQVNSQGRGMMGQGMNGPMMNHHQMGVQQCQQYMNGQQCPVAQGNCPM